MERNRRKVSLGLTDNVIRKSLCAGRTVSYWEASENLIEKDGLNQQIETDVGIGGGGISGLTTTYLAEE